MLQLVLTVIIFMIIVIPVGQYLYHIAAGKHTLADPVFDRVDGVIYKMGGVHPAQGHELETVCAGSSGHQRRHGVCRLSGPAYSEHSALQPQRHRRHGADPVLQHHHQLHDQHQPAALLRRVRPVLSSARCWSSSS